MATLDPARILRTLADHDVPYLLVGGMAAVARVKQELGRPKDLRVAAELEDLRSDRDR